MLKNVFAKKYLVRWLIGLGVVLLVGSGALWWCKLSLDPERVFWQTIEQSLATSGVTLSSSQQNGESGLESDVQFSLGADPKALSRNTLTQGGAVVTTETLSTLGADYTRYAHIQTQRTNAQGGPLDLSKVLNVWAKTDYEEGRPRLLNQTVLPLATPLGSMPVLIADLNAEQRARLLTQMRNEGVYEPAYSSVKKERKNGRLYYTYDVKIQIIPYVHLLKEFAKQVGMHDLEGLDPNEYAGEPLTVQITVDARARHVTEVYLPELDFRQQFSAYDIPVGTAVPTDSVPASELENRLREL